MGRYPDTLPNHQLEQPDYQRYLDLSSGPYQLKEY